ncbi:MAG: hypothetical protein GX640_23015, partial [Fibrobacter sp.]|nr:hypothetical protein [Fibrobacter sp.]
DNPGGIIDSYKIIITTTTEDTFIRVSKNNILSITIDTFFCGSNSITALVKDHSGHWSKPFKYPVPLEISRGFPEIKALTIIDTAWYLKPVRLRFDAIDYNGTIKSVIIDWGDSRIDTIKSKEALIAIDRDHIYSSNPEKTSRNIRISVTDNDNNTTTENILLQLHSGIPSIAVSSSQFTCVSNDTVYIQNNTYENRFEVFQVISLHYTSSDSNGIPLYFYCDIDSPYSYTFNDAEGFTVRADSMQFESKFSYFGNSIFSTDSPPVKAVLFCIDNDGLVGTDTFFIRTYTLPAITIIKPAEGDLLSRSNLSVIWTGGVDQFLLLDTKFKLTIQCTSPQTASYSTKSEHTGYLKDIVSSVSPYEFTFKVDSSQILSIPSGASVFIQLEVFDRLGQITTAFVSTTAE